VYEHVDTAHGMPHASVRDFLADELLLAEVPRDVIRHSDGEEVLELVARAVALGRATREGEPQTSGS
jgi:hypothetical protein